MELGGEVGALIAMGVPPALEDPGVLLPATLDETVLAGFLVLGHAAPIMAGR